MGDLSNDNYKITVLLYFIVSISTTHSTSLQNHLSSPDNQYNLSTVPLDDFVDQVVSIDSVDRYENGRFI